MTTAGVAALRAAILYDERALRRSSATGAQAFVDILELRDHRVADQPETPLEVASAGLRDAFTGDAPSGQERFRQLSQTEGNDEHAVLARVLGLSLLAWSAPEDAEAVLAAARAVEALDDERLVAVSLMKLAGFASDGGHREVADQLLVRAIEIAPQRSRRLRWRLLQALARRRGAVYAERPPLSRDNVVDQPWIESRAAAAARDALKVTVESLSENPWYPTMRFGSTPLDRVQAAVLQAEWAGALWLVDTLRLQFAAVAIGGEARDTEEWERAVAYWIVGGGTHLGNVIRAAEAHFEPGSASRVVEQLAHGRRLRDRDRYVSVLVQLWDQLDEKHVRTLISDLSTHVEESGVRNDENHLLALLAFRAPAQWGERVSKMRLDEIAPLLAHVDATLIDRLDGGAVARLGRACAEVLEATVEGDAVQHLSPQLVALAAHLAQSDDALEVDRARLLRAAARVEGPMHLDCVIAFPQLQEPPTVAEVLTRLRDSIQREAEDGRRGRYTGWQRSPLDLAAWAASRFPDFEDSTRLVESLMLVGLDPLVLAKLRADSLHAVYRLARTDQFRSVIAGLVTDEPAFRGDPFERGDSEDWQRALFETIGLLATRGKAFAPRVLGYASWSDERIRLIAVQALGDLLAAGAESSSAQMRAYIWSTLASSLFDSSPRVVDAGVSAIARIGSVVPEVQQIVEQGMRRAFAGGRRSTRATIANSAVRLREQFGVSYDVLDELIDLARRDRSWIVRDAATDRAADL